MRVSGYLLAPVLCIFALGVNAMETITGTASYRERIAMPSGVTLEVRLEDVSLADAPAQVISSITVNDAGNPPYTFALPYNPDSIQDGRRYTVRASLRTVDRLLFTTDTHTPVLTKGAGTDVSIILRQVQSPASELRRMIGAFTYFADAATFTECGSSVAYPVAVEGAYPEAERKYLDARAEPMAPAVVVLEGTVTPRAGMEGGMRDMVIIDRVAGFVPGLVCTQAPPDAEVEDTYWRLLSVADAALPRAQGGRDPHIMLNAGTGGFSSTVGCNGINGSYTLDGLTLALDAGPMTLMACPPPLDEIERAWVKGLESTTRIIVTGPTLEMRNAQGETIAFLEAASPP